MRYDRAFGCRYLLNPIAHDDLDQIYAYTLDRWDIDQAESYTRELLRAFDCAAADPRPGRACEEIRGCAAEGALFLQAERLVDSMNASA